MNAIDTNRTVRDWAVEVPGATRYFEKVGIDYCCGGARPLAEVCAERGIDASVVVAALEALADQATPARRTDDPAAMTLTALVDHIESTHHVFTTNELARLEALFDKVCNAHGDRRPELIEMRNVFRELSADLLPHMGKEEQVLFPYVRALEAAAKQYRPAPKPVFGTVRNPIRMMMMEHDAAGELLARLRALSSDYVPPADACVSYGTLFRALAELERDLHTHIHKENNILFPRAATLEEGT